MSYEVQAHSNPKHMDFYSLRKQVCFESKILFWFLKHSSAMIREYVMNSSLHSEHT